MDNKKIAGVIFLLVFFSLVFYSVVMYNYSHSSNSQSIKIEAIIGSGACRIPDLDPLDPRVLPFIRRFNPPRCKNQVDFIQTNLDGTISFNETAFKQEQIDAGTVRCFYQEVYRLNGTDSKVTQRRSKSFSRRVRVFTDIAHVGCKSPGSSTTFYENFLPVYTKKRSVATRRGREKPNVLLVGLDSLSRLNCMRILKESYEYLENDLKAHIFRLHVKNGLNTRSNMMALLTGKRMFRHKSLGTLYPAELNNTRDSFHDNWPFIWKDFAGIGYASAIGENVPSLTMFNYKMKGFRYQPVDHYMRNFWLAWKLLKNSGSKTRKSEKSCVMNTPIYTAQLEWILNIMRMYKDNPVFGLTLDAFTHNHIGEFGLIDKPFRNLLESLHTEKLLENTILFVFGDHGVRSGSYRETWMGRLEDYTPFFSVVLPQWLKNEHPHLDQVLSYNEDKLTTWYDVHATLNAILQGDYGDFEGSEYPRVERRLSLFRKISSNRTCLDAGIPLQYCPCVREERMTVTDEFTEESGKHLVEIINGKLKNHRDKCAIFKLKSVKEAAAIQMENAQQSKLKDKSTILNIAIRLVIETSPHGAVFETVMSFNNQKKRYFANRSIERVDVYGSQGDCVKDRDLERYCYCI